ncbi:MAG: hypothetical protein H5T69_04120 [Chloroflexi bacterium]|nr:hypothetical protein [Chloroflexota bacterium]
MNILGWKVDTIWETMILFVLVCVAAVALLRVLADNQTTVYISVPRHEADRLKLSQSAANMISNRVAIEKAWKTCTGDIVWIPVAVSPEQYAACDSVCWCKKK